MRKRRRLAFFLLVLVGMLFLLARVTSRGPTVEPGSYLLVDLRGAFPEAPPIDVVGRFFAPKGASLLDLLLSLRNAARDDRVAGVLLRVRRLDVGWGKAHEIRDAIAAFRKSGKPVVAVIEQEILASNKEYFVASAADRVHVSPVSSAPLVGLSAQFLFLGGLWDKLDVHMHVEQMREYKTMGDFLAGKQMTPAHREMADSLLDSLNERFIGAIASARDLDVDEVRTWIDAAPSSPEEFRRAGLSDGIQYLRTVHDSLGGEQAPLVPVEEYASVDAASLGFAAGARIAVLYATGSIVAGESAGGPSGENLGADTIAAALDEVAEDDDIAALVLRIDSPGGSALASDLIWRARRAVQERKPVVVSMSDVAASGGYYIAVGADRIFAQPTTLTGSIGVVVARPMLRGLLAKAGIHVESLSRGQLAHIDDLTVPLGEAGRAKLRSEVEHIYREFLDRVAAGRNTTAEAVDEVARGRVWTGEQALERGLVDELGGFWDAVAAAKQLAEIDAGEEVELVFFPKSKGFAEMLSDVFRVRPEASLPEPWARLAAQLGMTPFVPGTVLTLMPYAIDVR